MGSPPKPGACSTARPAASASTTAGWRRPSSLARRLAPLRPTAIYSSPLERCVETVQPLAAACRLTVVERDDLIEMHAGSWTGKPLARLRRTKAWGEVQQRPEAFRFPGGGESFEEARARAIGELQTIARRHRRGRVVVATHGDIVRVMLADLAGAPLERFQRIVVDTASVSVVTIDRDGEPSGAPRERHGRSAADSPPAAARPSGRPRPASASRPALGREPARIGRMDLGSVDRITAGTIGEPGIPHVLPAGSGARSSSSRSSSRSSRCSCCRPRSWSSSPISSSRPASGPSDDELGLEDPVDPMWRAGRLSIGYDHDRAALRARDRGVAARDRRETSLPRASTAPPSRRSSSSPPPGNRCSPSRATALPSPTRAGRRASSAGTRSMRRATRVPR